MSQALEEMATPWEFIGIRGDEFMGNGTTKASTTYVNQN